MLFDEVILYKISKHLEVRGRVDGKKIIDLSDLLSVSTSAKVVTLTNHSGSYTVIRFRTSETADTTYTKIRKFLQPRDKPKDRAANACIKAHKIKDCPTIDFTNINIEDIIFEFIEKSDMTLADLAKKIGVAPSTLARWRDGYCKPSIRFQRKLENILTI